MITAKVITRFEAKFTRLGENECWLWNAGKDGKGYGAFCLDGKTEIASRVSWIIYRGPIPEGMNVLHSCDNPPCINPGHLFLGTFDDNSKDMVAKGRSKAVSGEKHYSTNLKAEDVQEIRRLRISGVKIKDIAKAFKISQTNVIQVSSGERWKHLPGPVQEVNGCRRGEANTSAKLTTDAVLEIRRLGSTEMSKTEIAIRFGVTRGNIVQIVDRKTWRHVQ